MNRSTKILLVISLITLAIVSVITYINLSFAPYSSARSQSNSIAEEKANIVQPDYFGDYTRTDRYFAVGGLTNKKQYRYIIINAKSGKTETFDKGNAPLREKVLQGVADRYSPTKILHINLGLYKGKPTWEVAFENKNNTVGYNLVDFKTGKSVQLINNI
ncbi:hypothetical protein [Companilactobacillus mishanensis]|uniref:DUF5590 domain-containing protein n=1 Tax=Companilactobacillus mishanensis TaxID=2486008 RepID=A0A5P0ZEY4_9LACO|nr:hypothetical protein [Companilactobacillus mishanensis]MQS44295.1 hypothetical protein [Companilactobacillus mishanensis]MQS51603.1 hypothetical protein [Companilactobacillus mishanensis]MQS88536.1 hypothetical protein [Companilactobacillus mishanensis]